MSDEREKVCYMCHRTESRTVKMIRLPGDIHVCTDCLQRMIDSIGTNGLNFGPLSGFPMWNAPQNGNDTRSDLPKEALETLPDILDENGPVVTPETEEKEEQHGNGGHGPGHGIPNISFINLSDLQQALAEDSSSRKNRNAPVLW